MEAMGYAALPRPYCIHDGSRFVEPKYFLVYFFGAPSAGRGCAFQTVSLTQLLNMCGMLPNPGDCVSSDMLDKVYVLPLT